MEVKPAGHIPYTEAIWNEYKERLVNTLREKAIDADTIYEDTDLKNYIVSYVESELMNEKKDNERLLLNTNIRLVHLEIDSKNGKKVYPLINEYRGHHLMKTFYFYKDQDNQCKLGCVDVKQSSIIIP